MPMLKIKYFLCTDSKRDYTILENIKMYESRAYSTHIFYDFLPDIYVYTKNY